MENFASKVLTLAWRGSGLEAALAGPAWPMDHGLLRGWGVFETMLGVGAAVPLWPKHWARLQFGARRLRIPLPSEQVFRDAIIQLFNQARGAAEVRPSPTFSRVRLTVTAGSSEVWSNPGAECHCVLSAAPWGAPQPMSEQAGLQLLTYPEAFSISPALIGCKHTSFLPWIMAAQYAGGQGRDDAVLLNSNGEVIETSHRNLFVWKDSQLWTPPLSSGCLPGIMRSMVLEIANQLGMPVVESPLRVRDCREATHMFLTSALGMCQIVRSWEGHSFAATALPETLELLEAKLRGAVLVA
ncbi:MAG: aminotransferase class IV family protein [Planctomycetaceae bacterium]|nr:aminotransferase class IV family protein [Planctomycetaceae bacterium]